MNSLGKWKTALQMVAMSGMLLLHRPQNVLGADHWVLEHAQQGTCACLGLLWAGAFLSVRVASSHVCSNCLHDNLQVCSDVYRAHVLSMPSVVTNVQVCGKFCEQQR